MTAIVTAINSNLFYWYWRLLFDGYHCGKANIEAFPFFPDSLEKEERCGLSKQSKQIIDQIDTVLATVYEFSHAELDFIINYDIKYRMGKELESEGGDA